jgi:hypothetical protein
MPPTSLSETSHRAIVEHEIPLIERLKGLYQIHVKLGFRSHSRNVEAKRGILLHGKLSNINPSFKRIFETKIHVDSFLKRVWEAATKKALPHSTLTARNMDGPFDLANNTPSLPTSIGTISNETLTTHNSTSIAYIHKHSYRWDVNTRYIVAIAVLAVVILFFGFLEIRLRKNIKRWTRRRREEETRRRQRLEARERGIRNGELVEILLGPMGMVTHVEYADFEHEQVETLPTMDAPRFSFSNHWG